MTAPGNDAPLPLALVLGLPALAFLLATGLNYGGQEITGPDEPRYAAAAREMLRSGDWTVPRYNGEVRLEKPALLYWSCAFFSLIFGVGPLACRLGPVLAGLGAVLVTAALGARLYGRRAGLLAGLVLATSWLFPQIGRTVLCDMPLTFFVVAAIALLRLSLDVKAKRRRRLLLLGAYLSCGLAVLTKGPVGLVLPLGVMAAWLAWEGRFFSFFGLLPLTGTLVTVLVAGPWYLAVALRGGEAAGALAEFFRHENYARFFRSFDYLDVPWKYLTASVPQGMAPWTLLVPAGLLAFRRFGRRPAEPGRAAENTELAFPMVWAGAVVGLFSATGQLGVWPWVGLGVFLIALLVVLFMRGRERYWKWIGLAAFAVFALIVGWVPLGGNAPGGTTRAFYVLAAYPGLAVAAGWALDRACARGSEAPWVRRLAAAVPLVIAVGLLGLALAAVIELAVPGASPLSRPVPNIAEYRGQPGFTGLVALAGALSAAGGLAALLLLLRKKLAAAVTAAALGVAFVQGCYWGGAIPLRDRVARVGELYRRAAPRMIDGSAPVLTYDVPATAEAVYCLDRSVRKIPSKSYGPENLRAELAKEGPRYLIINAERLAECEKLLAGRSVEILTGRRKRRTFKVLALDGAAVKPPGD